MGHSKNNELARLRQERGKSKATNGRKEKGRQRQVRFLIVCEGTKTEPYYFEALVQGSMSDVREVNVEGVGMGTVALIKETKAIKHDLEKKNNMQFDRVWVVFDKDGFQDFNQAITMAKDLGYGSAWSNEAFELWYCLHFAYLNTAIKRSAYITMIENALKNKPGNNNFTYTKGDPDIYRLLQKYGDENMAKKHAEKLRKSFNNTNYAAHNPCTMVDKLVDELQHPERFLRTTP
jgi:hypothetical protein